MNRMPIGVPFPGIFQHQLSEDEPRPKDERCYGFSMKLVQQLLTRDSMCRKAKCWPLLDDDRMMNIYQETSVFRINSLPSAIWRRYDECFIVDANRSGPPRKPTKPWSLVISSVAKTIKQEFAGINELLSEFHGRIYAAGGAIFKSIMGDNLFGTDIDLFFVDADIINQRDLKAADELLIKAITFLINYWFKAGWDDTYVDVIRSDHVTTLYLNSQNDACKVQFIHRVYPSIDQVIGGFDLGAAMVAWDGQTLLTTELGAYCAFGSLNIIDTSRRSTSYEHRLVKYATYCHTLFPGLQDHHVRSQRQHHPCYHEVLMAVKDIFDKYGLDVFGRTGHGRIAAVIKDQAAIMLEINDMLRAKGLLLETADLVEINPTPFDRRALLVEISQACWAKKWLFMEPSFLAKVEQAFEFWSDEGPPLAVTKFLPIDLPYMDIFSHMMGQHQRFGLRAARNGLIYGINADYDISTPAVVEWTKTAIMSDYEKDPYMWPELTPLANLSKLIHGQTEQVAAVMRFKSAGNDDFPAFDEPDRNQTVAFQVLLHKQVVELETANNAAKIEAALRQSLAEPYIGAMVQLLALNLTHHAEGHSSRLVQSALINGLNLDYDNLIAQADIVIKRLTGVQWIIDNPGRQWTSSINPIIAHPSDWYGRYYCSFKIGNEAIETCLRLARKRSDNFFAKLHKDVFNMILRQAIWEDSLVYVDDDCYESDDEHDYDYSSD